MTIQSNPASFEVKARKTKTARKAPQRSRWLAKQLRRQLFVSHAIGAVILAGIGLSLPHQALGVMHVIGAEAWEAWLLAIVIDLGFILSKLGIVFASDTGAKAFKPYAMPVIVGTSVASALFNAMAFAAKAPAGAYHWHEILAVIAGVSIPAFLYYLTQGWAKLYINATR